MDHKFWTDKSNYALFISGASFLISIAGLCVSFFNFHRDKEKLKIDAFLTYRKVLINGEEDNCPFLNIEIANSGRRNIILLNWGFIYADGGDITSSLNGKEGIILKEKEKHVLKREDVEGLIEHLQPLRKPVSIYFEDTLSKRHYAKNGKSILRKYCLEVDQIEFDRAHR